MRSLPRSHRPMLLLACALASAGLAQPAAAQVIYRSTGPDGRVTFSDRAPNPANSASANVSAQNARGAAGAGATLPYALRQVQARFPVTLYTGSDCSPCANARALLTQRGIPFTELSVRTTADIQALQALSGQTLLPFATIGRQYLEGFAPDEWHRYLDAAGYPRTSALPANYRQPPVRPLAPNAPDATPAPAAAEQPMAAPPAPASRVTRDNPAGLSF